MCEVCDITVIVLVAGQRRVDLPPPSCWIIFIPFSFLYGLNSLTRRSSATVYGVNSLTRWSSATVYGVNSLTRRSSATALSLSFTQSQEYCISNEDYSVHFIINLNNYCRFWKKDKFSE